MKIYISDQEIFIRYKDRSVTNYRRPYSEALLELFQPGNYDDEDSLKAILTHSFDWHVTAFDQLMRSIDDMALVNYLFAFHESSILLWKRVFGEEDIASTIGITEDELSLNRRIFKLALEQSCDIVYTKHSPITQPLLTRFDLFIEDLLYIGSEIISAAQFIAELRMFQSILTIEITATGKLNISRRGTNYFVFQKLVEVMQLDFRKGIFDTDGVNDFKDALQRCFHIDYDFAGGQIDAIKNYHNPELPTFQTIEPGILVQNLLPHGVSEQHARAFYEGLTLNRGNKLSIANSVYKVNSLERYLFRPILEIDQNGQVRQLIGMHKWAETILVLATNNFQWSKSPEEWKGNDCFQQFLNQKSDEHDALLENEVEKILISETIVFERNIKSFYDGKKFVSIEIPGVGEIDFAWIDTKRKKIVIADCKYSRARYDMISLSSDYSIFRNSYEKKIEGKSAWVEKNIAIIETHFNSRFPGLNLQLQHFTIEQLFIINTPTMYMYSGRTNTVCFFNLVEFIENDYIHPILALEWKEGRKTVIRLRTYPYFDVAGI